MKWLATVALLMLLPAGGLAQAKTTPAGVSKEVEIRTGHKLDPGSTAKTPTVPEGVSFDDGVTEEEAIAIALWNNPALQVEMAALGLARSDVIQAGMLTNPQLTMIFPFSFRILEATANWPIEAIWLRPRRVAAATLEMERAAETVVVSALDLVRDVRLAYAEYAASQTRAGMAKEIADERREIAVIVNARLRAGDISEFETNASVAEARMAEERAVRFVHETALARERLRGLLGFSNDDTPLDFVIPEAAIASPGARIISADAAELEPLNELIKQALDARPEMKAGELEIEAAGLRAKWERSRIVSVTAIAKEYGRGANGFEQGPGFQIELPIFNRNQGNISRAEADIERAVKQLVVTQQRIAAEVREAYLQFTQAREAHGLWRAQVLPPLEQDLRLAGTAYRSGDVAYLFVLETSRRYSDERLREVDYVLTTARALAQLERSVGRRLFATR